MDQLSVVYTHQQRQVVSVVFFHECVYRGLHVYGWVAIHSCKFEVELLDDKCLCVCV